MGRSKVEQNTQGFTAVFWSQYYSKMQFQRSRVQHCQLFLIYSLIWERRWTCTASFQAEEMRAWTMKESLYFFPPFSKILLYPKQNMSAK